MHTNSFALVSTGDSIYDSHDPAGPNYGLQLHSVWHSTYRPYSPSVTVPHNTAKGTVQAHELERHVWRHAESVGVSFWGRRWREHARSAPWQVGAVEGQQTCCMYNQQAHAYIMWHDHAYYTLFMTLLMAMTLRLVRHWVIMIACPAFWQLLYFWCQQPAAL